MDKVNLIIIKLLIFNIIFLEFYKEHQGKNFYENLTHFICSDLIVGVEINSANAV